MHFEACPRVVRSYICNFHKHNVLVEYTKEYMVSRLYQCVQPLAVLACSLWKKPFHYSQVEMTTVA